MLGSLCVPLAMLGMPAAAQSARPTPDSLALQVAELINAYRMLNGLGPLSPAEDLSALAAEHSQDMAGVSRLSHAGFQARFQRSRSKVCVENVAFGFVTAERLFDGWRASPTHHRNLLEPKVERMGVAAAGRYVTFFACR